MFVWLSLGGWFVCVQRMIPIQPIGRLSVVAVVAQDVGNDMAVDIATLTDGVSMVRLRRQEIAHFTKDVSGWEVSTFLYSEDGYVSQNGGTSSFRS